MQGHGHHTKCLQKVTHNNYVIASLAMFMAMMAALLRRAEC